MMRHVDLCSGIGGFALGFEWAGLSRPVMFCDIEPWSRKVLAKHWPDVPIEEDVKVLANEPEKIPAGGRDTILTAGYPCQPFSQAGKRRGTEDDRHIWPYIREVVAQKRPAWCVFENVYGHVSMGLDEVLSDLEGEGYAARPFIVPACAADAPHRRDRVWIIARNVAYADNRHRSRKVKGILDQSDRQTSNRSSRRGEDVADSNSAGLQGRQNARDISQSRAQRNKQSARRSERPDGQNWKPEPPVGRVANGIPRRVDRLKGLGNAIVPQIAMRIGQTIKAVHDIPAQGYAHNNVNNSNTGENNV